MRGKTVRTAFAGVSALVLSTVLASGAFAQDMVVMRKVIAPRVDNGLLPGSMATPTPYATPATPAQPGDVDYYSWVVTDWKQSAGTCGSRGVETRDVACRNTLGAARADSFCIGNGSGPKPIASRNATMTDSCGYSWQTTDWPAVTDTCGITSQTRSVVCARSDGTPSTLCSASSQPAASRTTADYTECGYGWTASAWGGPSTTCGEATQNRTVSCLRSDGTTVADAKCTNAGDRPTSTETTQQTSGCVTSWHTGDWKSPAACGPVVQTRSVTCQQANGVVVPDQSCSGTKPDTQQDGTDYSTCATTGPTGPDGSAQFSWRADAWSGASTTCGNNTLTRTVQCVDKAGVVVPDSVCAGAKPDTTESDHEVSGCTTGWTTGEYGAVQPGCGATVQTRSVSCVRSDGQIQLESQCTAADRPADSKPATDYSACSFGWTASAWSDYSTTCGSATQTRTASCQRSDGSAADDAQCDPSKKPDLSQTTYQTSGCGLSWHTGDWGASAPACGASTQTRDVTCLRSDGQTVDDAQCSIVGAKPTTTQPSSDYSTCTYSWSATAYTGPTTMCGTVTQTRTVSCVRSDTATVADSSCSAAGTKPASNETTTQTTGCTYAWVPSAWGSAVPACGASTHSRTVSCRRSDGTPADASSCTGAQPATTEATTDATTCTYGWNVGLWQGSSTTCGDTITQSRTVTCTRSDGTPMTDANCSAAKPPATQTISDYSGCSYSWQVVNGPWSSTCSAAATRTNTVTCVRSDKTEVDDGFCTTTKPSETDTQAVTTSCSYTPAFGPFGTCSAVSTGAAIGSQTATIATCTRSDGVVVANSSCSPATKTQSCSVTYVSTYGTTYGTCTPTSSGSATGTQKAAISSCAAQASDGTTSTVSNGYCSTANAPTQSCTPTYTPAYGSWGVCTPTAQGATTGNETQTITACTDANGAAAPVASCTPQMNTRSCTGIVYSETYGSTYGTCTNSTQTAPIATCTTRAADNIIGSVATGLCPAASQTTSQGCNSSHVCGTMVGPPGTNVSTGTDVNGRNTISSTALGTYVGADWATAIPLKCQKASATAVFCYALASSTSYATATWTIHVLTGPAAPQTTTATTSTTYAAAYCQ